MKSYCVLNTVLTPAAGECLGSAAVNVLGPKIAVLAHGEAAGYIANGINRAGGCALLFNNCFESQLYFTAQHFSPDGLFFVQGEKACTVTLYAGDTQPISEQLEKEISAVALQGVQEAEPGETVQADLSSSYYKELILSGEFFDDVGVRIKCKNKIIKDMLTRALLALSGSTNGKAALFISPTGLVLSAADENGKLYTHEQLLDVCCACALAAGEALEVPFSACMQLDEIAAAAGVELKRSFIGGNELWQKDAVFLSAKLMHFMAAEGCGLHTLCSKIAPQAVSRKSFISSLDIVSIADKLSCEHLLTDNANTVFAKFGNGHVYITKSNAADRFCVEARAAASETARELVAAVEQGLA